MVESSDGSGAGLAVPVLLWRPKGGKKHDIFSSVPDPDPPDPDPPDPDPQDQHIFGGLPDPDPVIVKRSLT
jgi:hypothetical protein